MNSKHQKQAGKRKHVVGHSLNKGLQSQLEVTITHLWRLTATTFLGNQSSHYTKQALYLFHSSFTEHVPTATDGCKGVASRRKVCNRAHKALCCLVVFSTWLLSCCPICRFCQVDWESVSAHQNALGPKQDCFEHLGDITMLNAQLITLNWQIVAQSLEQYS